MEFLQKGKQMDKKFLSYDELKILRDFIKYCEDKTKILPNSEASKKEGRSIKNKKQHLKIVR